MFVTVMYHLVDDRIVHPMSVPSAQFERQLAWLADKHVTWLTADDADLALDGVVNPGPDPILVTFDDGYLNTVRTALPRLLHYGVPATMAVCGSYLDPATRPAAPPHPSRDFARTSDVLRWLEAGQAIAAHSYRHPKLTRLAVGEVEDEVARDHAALAAAFGAAPHSFCYPYGSSSPAVRQVVGRYYRNAYATGGGVWPSPADRLQVRRLQVRPEWSIRDFQDAVETALRECGAAKNGETS